MSNLRSVRASTISSLSEWSSTSKVRASNETRSSLATTNGDSINAALRANPMIELVDLRANSKENQGRSSRMNSSREAVKLPPKSGAACASSREHVVSSKKKSVRASTMSSLRELESIPKPPVMPSRDRSWGRSQQRVGGRDPSGSRSRPRPDNAPLESPRLSREVLAKLGNRQTKVVGHSGSGKMCAACEKPLTDDGFFAMGTLFHQACFRYTHTVTLEMVGSRFEVAKLMMTIILYLYLYHEHHHHLRHHHLDHHHHHHLHHHHYEALLKLSCLNQVRPFCFDSVFPIDF